MSDSASDSSSSQVDPFLMVNGRIVVVVDHDRFHALRHDTTALGIREDYRQGRISLEQAIGRILQSHGLQRFFYYQADQHQWMEASVDQLNADICAMLLNVDDDSPVQQGFVLMFQRGRLVERQEQQEAFRSHVAQAEENDYDMVEQEEDDSSWEDDERSSDDNETLPD